MSESGTAVASDFSPRPASPVTEASPARVSRQIGSLAGSTILRIAGEIRTLREQGREISDFTVGDFDPRQFRIPKLLEQFIAEALHAGETNYPPSIGMPALRKAVVDLMARDFGLDYPAESVLVTCGSRPGLYGAFATLCDPGDRVVYGVPSWNNSYYCHLTSAVDVPVRCGPETRFLPTAGMLRPFLPNARLLALNSPINPTGSAFDAATLAGICDAVLEENARRAGKERPLYLLYDQVYWMLTTAGVEHVDPVSLRPEMAAYTIYVDGISKAFAATGIRVGWVVGPADVIAPMNALLQHIGTWAPRAEQLATARFLGMPEAVGEFRASIRERVQKRLKLLANGLNSLRGDGLPVETTVPMGAMYLSARFALNGRTIGGETLSSNDDVRRYILERAGVGMVPFQGFGVDEDTGWFRMSVGAVSEQDIEAMMPRLREALQQ
jgi:aspartate aminotransferase